MTQFARSSALAGLVALSAGIVLWLGADCGEPPFEVSVTFPGPLDIERGASVRYQGIEVGEVAAVELRQASSDAPAFVELTLEIHNRRIALRRADSFEVKTDGLMGDDYIAITAAAAPSPPLAHGSRVAGTPPLVTRLRDSAGEAFDRLGALAREQKEVVVDALRGYGATESDDADTGPAPNSALPSASPVSP